MLHFTHHVTITQRLHGAMLHDLPLEKSELITGAKVVVLLLQEVDFFGKPGDLLKYLQALRHVAEVLRAGLLGEQWDQRALLGFKLATDCI